MVRIKLSIGFANRWLSEIAERAGEGRVAVAGTTLILPERPRVPHLLHGFSAQGARKGALFCLHLRFGSTLRPRSVLALPFAKIVAKNRDPPTYRPFLVSDLLQPHN